MKLVLSLACDEARLRPDGKLDVNGIFNELNAPGFPAAQDRMTVVFVMEWPRDVEGSIPFRADLVDEADQKILSIQGHTEVRAAPAGSAPATTKLVMPLERVICPHPGDYRFELTARGQSAVGIPLHLLEVEQGDGRGPGRMVEGT